MTQFPTASHVDVATAGADVVQSHPDTAIVTTSLRLDRELHAALRQIAFDRHVSMHSLLIEGARDIERRHTSN
jgi:hypothetical protein